MSLLSRFSVAGAICVVASSTLSATAADTLNGKVVHIADGDTITVLDSSNQQHKVRLWGIDAPERKQPFGTKAKEALGARIHEKQVTVETHGTDKYGRTLGTVFVDGRNVNQEMVSEGMAWWYEQFSKHAKELAEAQENARSAGRGLWADKGPVPPWEWRRAEKARGKVQLRSNDAIQCNHHRPRPALPGEDAGAGHQRSVGAGPSHAGAGRGVRDGSVPADGHGGVGAG